MLNKRILILFFHPRFEDSKVNVKLVEGVKQLSGVTFRDMYEIYPDFNINIIEEQKILLEHDIIIWHHPFYWYNCPPLMKQWLDLVLEYGWAYSSGGNFNVYHKEGRNRFTHREFLNSFDQTAHLCLMEYLPPFIVPGANKLSSAEIEDYMIRYEQIVHFLMKDKIDVSKLRLVENFNQLNEDQWEHQFYKTQ